MIKSAKLFQFRNYHSLNICFNAGVNFFIGQNGHGKTNLIEALYLGHTGQYLRSRSCKDLIDKNSLESSIILNQLSLDGESVYITRLNQKNKTHWIDEKKVTTQTIFKKNSSVIFIPESLNSIKQGPEERRALIDSLVLQTNGGAYFLWLEFRKALATRNRVLKDHKEGRISQVERQNLLNSLNPTYLNLATRVTLARLTTLKHFKTHLRDATQKLFNNQTNAELQYLISGEVVNEVNPEVIHRRTLERAQELAQTEVRLGTSLVGPHKHEVEFIFNNYSARNYCSQGQQRALILAFKMAQIVYHRHLFDIYPSLFLDDVLSELDEERCNDLIKFLQQIPTQVFLTSTRVESLQQRDFTNFQVFEIHDGKIINQAQKGL